MSKNVVADTRLRSIVDRLVRLHEERKQLGDDAKEVMQEAKSAGYDIPGLRLVVKRQLEDDSKRRKRIEAEETAELMEAALGEFGTSPLGAAAIERAPKAA